MKKRKKEKKAAGEWLRICLECLKRNERYQELLNDLNELWECLDDNNAGLLIERTKEAFEEFGLNYISDHPFDIPKLPDPNKPFEELISPDFKLKRLFLIFHNNGVMFTQFVDRNKEKIYSECLRIDIDFSKINSIDALKDHINFAIDEHWQHMRHFQRYKRKRINWKDFDENLQIGDKIAALKKANPAISWPELAQIIFPKEWENEFARESLLKRARDNYNRYTAMITDGWMRYRFP